MLPHEVKDKYSDLDILDFGLGTMPHTFEVHDTYCLTPTTLVLSYALAIASAASPNLIYTAGFDGFSDDVARVEVLNNVLLLFQQSYTDVSLVSLTPTQYKNLSTVSLYGML